MASELDASTFQRKLETLAEVIAQKLRREAPKLLGATPGYVSVDLHVMLRQMIYTYNNCFEAHRLRRKLARRLVSQAAVRKLSAHRSSPLPCACCSTSSFSFRSSEILLGTVRKTEIRSLKELNRVRFNAANG